MRKPRDRNLSDLTPILAEYILWHAIQSIDTLAENQSERTGPNGERYQAQELLREAINSVRLRRPKRTIECNRRAIGICADAEYQGGE